MSSTILRSGISEPCCVGSGFYLFIRNRRQTPAGNAACSAVARAALLHGDHVLFTHLLAGRHRPQVALDHVVVIEVFGIFVSKPANVVVVRTAE